MTFIWIKATFLPNHSHTQNLKRIIGHNVIAERTARDRIHEIQIDSGVECDEEVPFRGKFFSFSPETQNA